MEEKYKLSTSPNGNGGWFSSLVKAGLLPELKKMGVEWLSNAVAELFAGWQVNKALTSLVVDGIIAGVGGILTFLPNIFILFLALAFLEELVADAEIGDMVMEELKSLDEVAYVRFASVHRQFKDINTLLNEIESLVQLKETLTSDAKKTKDKK